MIKQPILAGISALLLCVVLFFLVERSVFLLGAEKAQGRVSELSAYDSRCGRRRGRHPCTKFSARVEFATMAGQRASLNLSAGSARGHGQSVQHARYQQGQAIPVIYNPRRPSQAYHHSFLGVWGTPLMVLAFQIATFIGSLGEGRQRR